MLKPKAAIPAPVEQIVIPTFKVLNINGKEIAHAKTYAEACNQGMLLSPDSDFMIKEGTRKAEVMDLAFRRWHNWFYNPDRKIVEVEGGFRLV